VVSELYRCPEDLLDIELTAELQDRAGYFRFGPDAICYGRSTLTCSQANPSPGLCNAIEFAETSGGVLRLPFDPSEIIENLRLERYPECWVPGYKRVLKRLYYFCRPPLLSLRKAVQKLHAGRRQATTFPNWPVDTTVENICESVLLLAMQATDLESIPFIWFWPDAARAAAIMTHDVETELGRDLSSRLMDLDDEFGIKASFQVVPEGRYSVSSSFLESIRERGFDIAIQDLNHDGRLFDDLDEFSRRATRINRYAREYSANGFRSAVLYRRPEWYDLLNFSFDMSIPNVARLDPQPGGCCTVMPYFIGNMLELPVTTTQDYMLFHLLNERSIALWKSQLALIMGKNGLASFIIHPDYITGPDTISVYRDLLSYLADLRREEGVWITLPAEIDSWWRARNSMSLVRNGSSWRIEGEYSERAVLAWARNVDGKLVYELP
jgi:hypothetical protein